MEKDDRKFVGLFVLSCLALIAGLVLILLSTGCDCNRHGYSETRTNTTISGQTNLLDAKDFDLNTVMSMIKENKVDGADALEKAINSNNGINNVDLDKDGQIDYISVKERREGGNINLDMMAIPSKTKDPNEAVVIASVSFSKNTTTNGVDIKGGYPKYVHGYNDHYYHYHHHGLSFGEAMFLAWMFTPRPIYYHPFAFRIYGYAPRPVYTSSQLSTRRTTYRKQVKVNPIRKTSRPKNYSISSAKKVPSRFKKQLSNNKGNYFKSRSGSSRKFKSRSGQTNRSATGWGKSNRSRSRSWGSSSSGSRSKSWGSSSSGSRSRSWGSSSGGSRSWGGSRSFGRSRSSGRRSDGNFKTDIKPINNALNKVSKINGVYFKFKGDNVKRSGVIAQDVNKVFPEVVSKDDKGYLVDYEAMLPLLIEAIKELRIENKKIYSRMKKCTVK